MARCLVTGAAGFIGSHLCEQLLRDGHTVVGLDAFIPYYPREIKLDNLASLREHPEFIFHQADLRDADLLPALEGVEAVFHLAAMPGLPRSWSDFNLYMTCNMEGTQRLLEAARVSGAGHFIYGSTSSVYGRFATGNEESPLAPISPYGVTKLGAEHLCQAYADNFEQRLTILRFYSVYGPRQRPDMAYHNFIRALLRDEPITVFGDGGQSRSNTFVGDCVRGIVLAFEQPDLSAGQVFNIGGGEEVKLVEVLGMLEELTGKTARLAFAAARPGDQRRTAADIGKAQRMLGYTPATSVLAGLTAQVAWQRRLVERDVPISERSP